MIPRLCHAYPPRLDRQHLAQQPLTCLFGVVVRVPGPVHSWCRISYPSSWGVESTRCRWRWSFMYFLYISTFPPTDILKPCPAPFQRTATSILLLYQYYYEYCHLSRNKRRLPLFLFYFFICAFFSFVRQTAVEGVRNAEQRCLRRHGPGSAIPSPRQVQEGEGAAITICCCSVLLYSSSVDFLILILILTII